MSLRLQTMDQVGLLSIGECISVAQEAEDLLTTSALQASFRASLASSAGLNTHAKGWDQAVERLRASAGSVRTEKDLPAYVDSYLRAISKFKAGMLLINYIGMEISKRANLPMSELIRSMATTTTFDPDTASVEETAMYAKVQKLLSEANFLSGEAVKIKVEKLVDASVMKPTRPGDVCYWREDDKCTWSTGKDVAIVIKIGTEGHSDSAMCATPNSPSQHQRGLPRYIRFANLTLADNRGEDSELIDAEDGQELYAPQAGDRRLLKLDPCFAAITYTAYCESSGYHKLIRTDGQVNPSLMQELDEALAASFSDGIENMSLRNDITFGSKGRVSEMLIYAYIKFCASMGHFIMESATTQQLKFASGPSAIASFGLRMRDVWDSVHHNPNCLQCCQNGLARAMAEFQDGVAKAQSHQRARGMDILTSVIREANLAHTAQETAQAYHSMASNCEADRPHAAMFNMLQEAGREIALDGKSSAKPSTKNREVHELAAKSICYNNVQKPGGCRFGDRCRHLHVAPGSSQHTDWLNNSDEQEKYTAFLEKAKSAAAAAKKERSATTSGTKSNKTAASGGAKKSTVTFPGAGPSEVKVIRHLRVEEVMVSSVVATADNKAGVDTSGRVSVTLIPAVQQSPSLMYYASEIQELADLQRTLLRRSQEVEVSFQNSHREMREVEGMVLMLAETLGSTQDPLRQASLTQELKDASVELHKWRKLVQQQMEQHVRIKADWWAVSHDRQQLAKRLQMRAGPSRQLELELERVMVNDNITLPELVHGSLSNPAEIRMVEVDTTSKAAAGSSAADQNAVALGGASASKRECEAELARLEQVESEALTAAKALTAKIVGIASTIGSLDPSMVAPAVAELQAATASQRQLTAAAEAAAAGICAVKQQITDIEAELQRLKREQTSLGPSQDISLQATDPVVLSDVESTDETESQSAEVAAILPDVPAKLQYDETCCIRSDLAGSTGQTMFRAGVSRISSAASGASSRGDASAGVGDLVRIAQMSYEMPDLLGRVGQILRCEPNWVTIRVERNNQAHETPSSGSQVVVMRVQPASLVLIGRAPENYGHRRLLASRLLLQEYPQYFAAPASTYPALLSESAKGLRGLNPDPMSESQLTEEAHRLGMILCLHRLESGTPAQAETVSASECQLLLQLLLQRELSEQEAVIVEKEVKELILGTDVQPGMTAKLPLTYQDPTGSLCLRELRRAVLNDLWYSQVDDSNDDGGSVVRAFSGLPVRTTEVYAKVFTGLSDKLEMAGWKTIGDETWCCGICFSSDKGVMRLSCCGNHFHIDCLRKVVSDKCPACKIETNELPTGGDPAAIGSKRLRGGPSSAVVRESSPGARTRAASPAGGAGGSTPKRSRKQEDLGAELQSLRSNVQQHQQTVSDRVNKFGVKESKELAKLRKIKEASLEKLEKERAKKPSAAAAKREKELAAAKQAQTQAEGKLAAAVLKANNCTDRTAKAKEAKAKAKETLTLRRREEALALAAWERTKATLETCQQDVTSLSEDADSAADSTTAPSAATARAIAEIESVHAAAVEQVQERTMAEGEACLQKAAEDMTKLQARIGAILHVHPEWVAALDPDHQFETQCLDTHRALLASAQQMLPMEVVDDPSQGVLVAEDRGKADAADDVFTWALSPDMLGVQVEVDDVLVCTVETGSDGASFTPRWSDTTGLPLAEMETLAALYGQEVEPSLAQDLGRALKSARDVQRKTTGQTGWRFTKRTAHTDLAKHVLAVGRAATQGKRQHQQGVGDTLPVYVDTCAAVHMGNVPTAERCGQVPDVSKGLWIVGVDQQPKKTEGECTICVTQTAVGGTKVELGLEAQIDNIGNKVIASCAGLVRDQDAIVVLGLDPGTKAWSSFLMFSNGTMMALSLTRGGMTVMGTNSSVCEGGTLSSVTEPLPIAAEMLARWERSQQACNRVAGDMLSDGEALQAAAEKLQEYADAKGAKGEVSAPEALQVCTVDATPDSERMHRLGEVLSTLVADKLAECNAVSSRTGRQPKLDAMVCHDLLHGGEKQVKELLEAITGKPVRAGDVALLGDCIVCQETKMTAPFVRRTATKQAALVHVCEKCLAISGGVLGSEEAAILVLAGREEAPDAGLFGQ